MIVHRKMRCDEQAATEQPRYLDGVLSNPNLADKRGDDAQNYWDETQEKRKEGITTTNYVENENLIQYRL